MKVEEWFKKKLDSFREDFEFRLESIILDITEKICQQMKKKNITRSRLAEKLNVSPPAVTKILNGNSNFTLKTLLSLSDALGLELNIDFTEKSYDSMYIDINAVDEQYFYKSSKGMIVAGTDWVPNIDRFIQQPKITACSSGTTENFYQEAA